MSRPPPNERGFILISAIWLLVLCGAIAAILMLRSIGATQAAAAQGERTKEEALLAGAVETVFAGILFADRRSQSTAVPSSGTITVGGRDVTVSLTNEAGRIDLNEYPIKQLEAALQGLAVQRDARQRIVRDLEARRLEKRPLTSMDEVRPLFAGIRSANGEGCVEDEFTIHSGFASPLPNHASARLARALGLTNAGRDPRTPNAEPVGAGTPLRVEASMSGQAPLIVVARITGLNNDPITSYRWEKRVTC